MRALALAVVAALTVAGDAGAAGSTRIASAPLVRPGVAQTEDTIDEATRRGKLGSELSLGCWVDYEFWRLPLKAGDRVAIAGNNTGEGLNFAVGVYPVAVGPSCYDGMDGTYRFVVRVTPGG